MRSERWIFPLRWTLLDTFTMRLGADAFNVSSKRFVSRNGPRWFVANCISRPSTVRARSPNMAALLMSMSSRVSASRNLQQARINFFSSRIFDKLNCLYTYNRTHSLIDSWDERSNSKLNTFLFPLSLTTSNRVSSHLCQERQAIYTRPTRFAISRAISLPIPVLLPLTITILPYKRTALSVKYFSAILFSTYIHLNIIVFSWLWFNC